MSFDSTLAGEFRDWTGRDDVYRLLWLSVVLAAAADIALTVVGLSLCFSEQNPVAAAAVAHAGPAGLVALKAGTIAVLAGAVQFLAPRHRRIAVAVFCLPQALAVGHNSLLLAAHAGDCL